MRIHNYLNRLERSGMETDVRSWETQPKAQQAEQQRFLNP
jgi:hypothetical protein